METLFDLNKYKKHLIDILVYEIDNNEFSKEKRKQNLANYYGDEFLQRIINDTLQFIIFFIEKNLNNQHGYVDFDLSEDLGYISLNLTGGWFSDILYSIDFEDSKLIVSNYLLREFLGTSFRIEDDYRGEEVVDEAVDFTIYNTYWYPFIRIVGDFELLEIKKEELIKSKQKELVTVLKRNLIKKSNGLL